MKNLDLLGFPLSGILKRPEDLHGSNCRTIVIPWVCGGSTSYDIPISSELRIVTIYDKHHFTLCTIIDLCNYIKSGIEHFGSDLTGLRGGVAGLDRFVKSELERLNWSQISITFRFNDLGKHEAFTNRQTKFSSNNWRLCDNQEFVRELNFHLAKIL
jgi:hypothetical protein